MAARFAMEKNIIDGLVFDLSYSANGDMGSFLRVYHVAYVNDEILDY